MPKTAHSPLRAVIKRLEEDSEEAVDLISMPAESVLVYQWRGVVASVEAAVAVREAFNLNAEGVPSCTDLGR